ncbi:hypothetical protein [Saccharothrix hoggarensis]|uniref:Uncharacterized protein n=1 Tax=Saccharothrix hoggarensis TaxID=913853 RepID=A0ABW3QS72_9PSEU
MSTRRTTATPVLKSLSAATGLIAVVVTGHLLFGVHQSTDAVTSGDLAAHSAQPPMHLADTHW